MAWEWSHTNKAYDYAYRETHKLPTKDLRVIYAEWRAHAAASDEENPCGSHGGFDEPAYERALKQAVSIAHDTLADDVWERAAEQRTCSNGGFVAWLCPYGCGCHTVAFGPDDE